MKNLFDNQSPAADFSKILAGQLSRLEADIKTLDSNIQKLHNHFSIWVENVDMIAFAALMMIVNDGKYELTDESMKKTREKIDEISKALQVYRDKLVEEDKAKDDKPKKGKIVKEVKKRVPKIIT